MLDSKKFKYYKSKDDELKIGDIIILKTLKKIKSQYNHYEKYNGYNFGDLHINDEMTKMLGKEWRVKRVMSNHFSHGYDFDISGPTGNWAFSKEWIETEKDIIDINNLFEELESDL